MSKNRTIHSVKKSRYLTRADVDPAVLVTIQSVTEEDIGMDNSQELKWVVHTAEFEKGLVLNWINSQTIARILGSESFDEWTGGRVVLYDDPHVSFGGQLVGGIRVRAPRRAVRPKPAAKPAPEPDDEIPFGKEWDDETEEVV